MKKQVYGVICLAAVLGGCHKPLFGASRNTGNDSTQTQALEDHASYEAVAVRRDSQGKIINPLRAPSNQTYYFAFDKSQVAGDDFAAIRVQAAYLVAHPDARVRLEGNTDDMGSREYNIALGWRRDQAIAHMLTQYGARRSQLIMVSYGKEKPAAVGTDEHARRLNRRVALVYEAY